MKQVLFSLAALISFSLHAQVDRNDVLFSAGGGYSIIVAESSDSAGTASTSDYTTGLHIPVYAEYVFSRRYGLGVHFNYTRIFNGSMFPHKSSIMETAVTLTLHSARWQRFDMAGYLGLGYSRFYNEIHGDFNHEKYRATGISLLFALYPRFYLNQHLGLGLLIDGSGANYNNAEYSDDFTTGYKFKMKTLLLSGNVGIFYKL